MRIAPKPDEVAEIYIDESSQNNHRYLVIGGVVAMMADLPALIDDIAMARMPDLPKGEVKWSKVSKAKLAAYKRIVDALFDNPKGIHFHCLVIDTTLQDHKRFNAGSREIGFNKEIQNVETS